jgi:hypothetical protein
MLSFKFDIGVQRRSCRVEKPMGLGRRGEKQMETWVAGAELPRSPANAAMKSMVHCALSRLRSEYPEGSFAHTCETGRARRSWLRGTTNIAERWITAGVRNLGVP